MNSVHFLFFFVFVMFSIKDFLKNLQKLAITKSSSGSSALDYKLQNSVTTGLQTTKQCATTATTATTFSNCLSYLYQR